MPDAECVPGTRPLLQIELIRATREFCKRFPGLSAACAAFVGAGRSHAASPSYAGARIAGSHEVS